MKKINIFYLSLMAMVLPFFFTGIAVAQDSAVSSTTTTTSTSSSFTVQPWMWVVSGIIILIIIIALVSRGSKDKVVITKEHTIE